MLAEAAELDEVATGEPPVLAVSNTLWAREDIAVKEGFAQQLLREANSRIRDAPFGSDPDAARRLINSDIADTTNGQIPELIPPGAFDAATVAALVNALYLKVAWRHRFPERATTDRHFVGCGEVPTMRLTEHLGYARRDGWQAVVLPAAGGVEVAVLLPEGELRDAEPALTADGLAALLDAASPTRVELTMPRFRVDVVSPLTQVLRTLGARAMFTREADFSALSREPLVVSAVLHEAVLRVDEDGLEGAAATAMAFKMAAAIRHDDPVVVRVDRPFLFLVRHRASGALYFLARVVRP